ncbi:golgin subfamily A member 5 [Pelobates cultripes]|uniref:Golgin subfamily A member 5 n=1 Tax=Pelobates cultripes TaxID=61616 RepID=A0AAD1TPM0_PELCU|nr:golgin subfamily A member 5 [Pelobates cultripes]
MSWFTDLAGKAEDLLNLVDQGAATALSKSKEDDVLLTGSYPSAGLEQENEKNTDKHQSYGKSSFISSAADNIKHQKATMLAGTANVKTGTRTAMEVSHSSSSVPSHRATNQFVRRKKSEPDDELLFDFLNSSDKVHNSSLDSKKETSKETVSVSPSAARSSSKSVKTSESLITKTQDKPSDTQSEINIQEDVINESKVSETEKNSNHGTNGDQKSHELSNLRLENQLLRSEVQSLNQEMATLIQRSKETHEELNEARTRIEKWNSNNSKSDRSARELRAQVDDLTEAMAAKDSQLAVLKIRLQEADQLLHSRTEALEILQSEKSRYIYT